MAKLKETVIETEWKGNPMLEFTSGEGDRFPFSLGISKLASILHNIEAVEEFVTKHMDGKE